MKLWNLRFPVEGKAFVILLVASLFLGGIGNFARRSSEFAVGSEPANSPTTSTNSDWLIDPSPYSAKIEIDDVRKEIRLSNGLVERRIVCEPAVATVSLKNLTSGEELLRAVGPEAYATIDGVCYPIGGLTGQPINNYLKEEWIPELQPIPNAYRLIGTKIGDIEERFPWKKRSEWLSRDWDWPPKGKHLTTIYAPPELPVSIDEGETLFEDRFEDSDRSDWKTFVSASHERTSVANEGKRGEIFALPDVCAYFERSWEPNAVSLEVVLDVGDDADANSWGPGVALAFDDKTVSVVARPNSRQFELYLTGKEELVSQFDREQPITLQFRIDDDRLSIEASQPNQPPTLLARTKIDGSPKSVRVGKIGKNGSGVDYPRPNGELRRSHIHKVAFYGAIPTSATPRTADLPQIEIHYEIYDGLPLLSKWMVVKSPDASVNGSVSGDANDDVSKNDASSDGEAVSSDRESAKRWTVDRFVSEELRLAEVESQVERFGMGEKFNLHIESDYFYNGMEQNMTSSRAAYWEIDPNYPTQVNYARQTICLLRCYPESGPKQPVFEGNDFESFRVYELLFEDSDRERRGLALRRTRRTLSPWTAENPLMFHKIDARPEAVRDAIRQCQETGFELVIMSFGSGLNMENDDPNYRRIYRELSEEASKVGVALGGYSLTSSRGAATPADNVQNPKPAFGQGPCLGSQWGIDYLANLKSFMTEAKFGVFENDGPYPGDSCSSEEHPGHCGLDDSVWNQWRAQSDLYRWCRANGIFVNQPDGYFLNGGNKTGMGYRETNWSLPRAEQLIIERQNIFDGTWTKSASTGWMFVPLSQYHGGGAAATIEPLCEHLDHYDARFANLIGSGTQACYRGPRLFDSEETKKVVRKWVDFYKNHRRILDGDLVHLRRATGRDWDGWLHVDPTGEEKGLVFLYNPLESDCETTIQIPLYYAGLTRAVSVETGNQELNVVEKRTLPLDDRQNLRLNVRIPAESYLWFLFKEE